MRLSALADGFTVTGEDRDIASITEDSRKVIPGSLFVAVAGTAEDGHHYIADALKRGAVAVAADRLDNVPAPIARVHAPDARNALAVLASRFYGEPARDLELIGFTGTFGKTSTSEVLRSLLAAAGARPGVLGSLGARYDGFEEPSGGLTTPAPVELHRALRGLRNAGADRVIMEVTSHALRMRRVDGLTFGGGLLAAILPGEHTDFHRTYDDYVEAKRIFLDYLEPEALLAYDADNSAARALAKSRKTGRSVGFSLQGGSAGLVFTRVTLDASGATFDVEGPIVGHKRQTMRSVLLGSGHLRNVALALAYALASDVDPDIARAVLGTLRALPRRMERYSAAGRTVLDDTAAHPQSLRATFDVAALLPHDRLVVVYAVRGNRGVDINLRNAEALAALVSEHRAEALIVTASRDATGPADRVTAGELAALRGAVAGNGRLSAVRETLREAVSDSMARTRAGDLIVLVGAQGMNNGKRMLEEYAAASPDYS